MRAELVKLHQRLGVTTLYVTHDQVEAMTLGQRVAVLNHGVVQQVAPPETLYNQPANTFVASFIGSPAMNFLRASLQEGEVRFGTYAMALPAAAADRLRWREGDVLIGVRPEHFTVVRLSEGGQTVPVTVEITEQLGSETLVYFTVDGVAAESLADTDAELGGTFVARLDPRTHPSPGERLQLAIDLERAHFFDPADGSSMHKEEQ